MKMSFHEVTSSSNTTRSIALASMFPVPCAILEDAMTTTAGRGTGRGNSACRTEPWWTAQTFVCIWYPENSLRCETKVYLCAVIRGSQTSGDGASAGQNTCPAVAAISGTPNKAKHSQYGTRRH